MKTKVSENNYNWIDVPAIPGTFVVNLGDMAQYWSGGLYKSTLHRVLIKNINNSENNESLERYSVPFFCNCNFDTPIDVGGLVTKKEDEKEILLLQGENQDSLSEKVGLVSKNGDNNGANDGLTAGIYIMKRLGLMRKDSN